MIGADGKNSPVARTVDAPAYDQVPPQTFSYSSRSDIPVDGLEWYRRHHRFVLGILTNDA